MAYNPLLDPRDTGFGGQPAPPQAAPMGAPGGTPPPGGGGGGAAPPPAGPVAPPKPQLPDQINIPQFNLPPEDERAQNLLAGLQKFGGMEGRTGQQLSNYLLRLFGGSVLGAREFGGGQSFDPNNPQSFALLAPQMQQIAAQKDAALRALEQSGLSGGELDQAKAAAITGAYGQGAQARQGLMEAALQFMQQRGQEGRANEMGAENAGLGYLSGLRGQDIGALTTTRGQDLSTLLGQRGQDVGALLQQYGIDINHMDAQDRLALEKLLGTGNLDIQRERLAQEKDLTLQQLALQKQAQKKTFLGGLFGTLGQLIGSRF